MIEAKNVVKSFDGFRALDGLTMTVPHGSIYGLVGPNGAGKSTLLRHVTGVYRQDSGSVLIEGNPVYENPAAKSRIASIPDELYYFLSASTRDMMRFYRGFYPRFDVKRYEALKDVFTPFKRDTKLRHTRKSPPSSDGLIILPHPAKRCKCFFQFFSIFFENLFRPSYPPARASGRGSSTP